jgi:hypothetical protein
MASFARRILSLLDVARLVGMDTRPRGWGWIRRLQARTFDRPLVVILLLFGLTSFLDLRFGDRHSLRSTNPGDEAYPILLSLVAQRPENA